MFSFWTNEINIVKWELKKEIEKDIQTAPETVKREIALTRKEDEVAVREKVVAKKEEELAARNDKIFKNNKSQLKIRIIEKTTLNQ